jgi:tetratricopeptide (TPR) repeat protein
MISLRSCGTALIALACLAAGSAAQGKKGAADKAPSCQMNYEDPSELKDAFNALNQALLIQQPEMQKKPLQKAVEKLTLRADHYSKNKDAHAYLLGQALVMWSKVPGTGDMPKRGTLGWLGDKEQPIDIAKTADSLFSVVEKDDPACTEQTDGYRQQLWGPMINQVQRQLNANKLDSASQTLVTATAAYPNSPYNAYFAGQIAYKQDSDAAASIAYEKAAKLGAAMLATDTSVAGITEYSTFMAPYTGQRAATVMQAGPDQTAALKRAIAGYQTYLKTYSCPQFAENAQSGIFDAMRTINDTAGLRTELANMATQTKPCSPMTWYNGARDAKDIGQAATAIQLADKAVAFSPWSAALGNAAAVYFDAKAWDKLLPVARRLTDIAPNMPDDYQLLALAYMGLGNAKGATPAQKKAYTDSATTVYEASEALDVNVRVSEFSSDGAKRKLGGTVTLVDHTPGQRPAAKGGKGKAAAAPSAVPSQKPKARQVTIKIDFIDKDGKPVASQSADVNASPDAPASFSVSAENAAIVGYRYTKIQ